MTNLVVDNYGQESLDETLSFLNWLFDDLDSDDFYTQLWDKLFKLINPAFLFLLLDNNDIDRTEEMSFGESMLTADEVIEAVYAKQASPKKPLHSYQKLNFNLDDGAVEVLYGFDRSVGISTIFILGKKDNSFSLNDEKLFHLVFHAITQKNQKLSWLVASQQLRNIREERHSQYNFISTITHDLRNPLGCIKGYVTTLLRTDVQWPTDTQQQFLQVINTESDHLEEMITNLLETARLQSGSYELNYQNVNLQLLLAEIIQNSAEKHPELSIFLEVGYENPFILADLKKMAYALQNLIDNARKHAKILEIWFKIRKESNGYLIECVDKGEGIPEDRLHNIFERFSRTPEFSPGSHGVGLGLYITKEIIERHQGSIQVESISGTGTTFSIYLPKAPTHILGKERG